MDQFLAGLAESIDSFFFALNNLSTDTRHLIAISVLVVGGLFGFLGFRFFKYLLGLLGFLALGLVGMTLFYYIPWVKDTGEIGQLLVGTLSGALGALVFYLAFYYFGIFVFGSVSAMWIGLILLPHFGDFGDLRLLIILGIGFAGGFLAFLMRKIIVILFTSIIGGTLMVMGIGHFAKWPVAATNFTISKTLNGQYFDAIVQHPDRVVIAALTAALIIAGIAIQINTTREIDRKGRD